MKARTIKKINHRKVLNQNNRNDKQKGLKNND